MECGTGHGSGTQALVLHAEADHNPCPVPARWAPPDGTTLPPRGAVRGLQSGAVMHRDPAGPEPLRTDADRTSAGAAGLVAAALCRPQPAVVLGSWTHDVRSDRIDWSPAFRQLLDIPADEAPSLDGFIDRLEPDCREGVLNVLQQL